MIVPVTLPQRKGDAKIIDTDEHPRADTSLEMLAKLKGIVKEDGTVTAGNASGVNDGACALLLASETAAKAFGLQPKARIVGMATAGVPPRIMGFGPAPAIRKLLQRTGLKLSQMEVIELNEAFAAQALARTRLADDAPVNPNGGAIAIGPARASGAGSTTAHMSCVDAAVGLPCALHSRVRSADHQRVLECRDRHTNRPTQSSVRFSQSWKVPPTRASRKSWRASSGTAHSCARSNS
jgi:hypothetical protein